MRGHPNCPTKPDPSKGDGTTTCLWHRQHQYYLENIVPHLPLCELCGGEVDHGMSQHHLCAARAGRGLPTPRLSVVKPCPCSQCRRKSKPNIQLGEAK